MTDSGGGNEMFTREESEIVVRTLLVARQSSDQVGDVLTGMMLDRIGEKLGLDVGWYAAMNQGPVEPVEDTVPDLTDMWTEPRLPRNAALLN